MTEVEKFFHCRLTGLFECMMINMRLDFVGKKCDPVLIDNNLPCYRSRSFKHLEDIQNLDKNSKDVFKDGLLEKYIIRPKEAEYFSYSNLWQC